MILSCNVIMSHRKAIIVRSNVLLQLLHLAKLNTHVSNFDYELCHGLEEIYGL